MRLLLLSAAALTAASALAATPCVLDNAQVQAITPDGSTIVSVWGGTVALYDAATGKLTAEYSDEGEGYTIGQGPLISEDGTMVGATPFGAAYLRDGVWTELNVPNKGLGSYAMGITPDGKMIVGNVGLTPVSIDDAAVPMMAGAYWTLQDDGSYSDCHVLPYPQTDLTGRVPQYVTAIIPSDDKKTIYGQVVDYSGSLITLITYTQSDDNEWSYNVDNKLINPDGIVFPPDPGEAPEWVNPENYMTEDEIIDYLDAVNNYDWESDDPYPMHTDFMTEEEKAAYESDLAAYNAALAEWQEKFNALLDVLDECIMSGHSLEFNKLLLSPDKKSIVSATAIIEEDPDSWLGVSETATPISINLENGTLDIKEPLGVDPTVICEDGTIFGFINGDWRNAAVYKPGAETPVSIYAYMQEVNPETAAWMKENMFHSIEMYNFETGEFEMLDDVEFTGTPFASPDKSVIACAVQNIWEEMGPAIYTYVFSGSPSGVNGVVADNGISVKALKGGIVEIDGEYSAIAVYDLNGANVFTSAAAGSSVATGLESGVYVVKVSAEAGDVTVKALF